jgi:hypothetical protein
MSQKQEFKKEKLELNENLEEKMKKVRVDKNKHFRSLNT